MFARVSEAILFEKHLTVFLKNAVLSARAGIRTRVVGMKIRNDGPDYTTRA